jgi:hypothetical protein
MKTVATGSSEMLAGIWQTTQYYNPEDQYLVITLHLNEPAQKMKLTYLNKGLQNTCNIMTQKRFLQSIHHVRPPDFIAIQCTALVITEEETFMYCAQC